MAGQPVWIEVDDGARLCADLYLPAGEGRWPALLEALPYRMHDVTASAASRYRALAEAGFAVCRVDLRGTGSSSGVASDEHPDVERDDLRTVIAWLAGRPWCTGRVGMFGASYSGSNALHMAADGIPALGAVVAAYATDDRYTDDAHHRGGVLGAIDLVDHVTDMVAMNALPPVPAVFGDGWVDEWRDRVERTPPWALDWLRQQADGPMWRRGSIRTGPDGAGYDRLTCPTMIVAGWADGHRNATFRTIRHLTAPWRLLAGPWSHTDPARSRPGPDIDASAEVVAFFDEHLRDGPGPASAPAQVFVRRPAHPEPDLPEHPGTWKEAGTWPPPGWLRRVLRTDRHGIGELDVVGDVGTTAWTSGAGELPWGQPTDQRVDDARSLTHDWPWSDVVELAGQPSVALRVRASTPVAHLAVKLCDVLPDGTSALVTRGMSNLTHRGCWPVDPTGEVGRRPSPLVPGEWVDVTVDLDATTWTLEPGHALRLVVAGTDWPSCWPPPGPVRLGLDWSSVELTLPVWASAPASGHPFRPGLGPRPVDDGVVWRIEHDVLGRETRAVTRSGGRHDGEFGAVVDEEHAGQVGVSTVDPARAWARGHTTYRVRWPEATVVTEAVLEVRSDAEAYDVTIDLAVAHDGTSFAHRRWTERIPRDLQ